MLTKEECLKALGYLEKLEHEKDQCDEKSTVLNQLIFEHFDNLPLKFDELKEGMWVWDNKMVLYIRIAKIIGKTIYVEDFLYGFDCYGRYEKNRFYRKQVKE